MIRKGFDQMFEDSIQKVNFENHKNDLSGKRLEDRIIPLSSFLDTIHLSKRELECLMNTLRGMTSKETARTLNISPRTVEFYLLNARRKISCKNNKDLFRKFFEWKIEYV